MDTIETNNNNDLTNEISTKSKPVNLNRYKSFDESNKSDIDTFAEQCRETTLVVEDFFNNRFDKAMEAVSEKSSYSLPHAHAKAMLKFFTAILTLEPDSIESAKAELKQSMDLCNSMRKPTSIRKSITSLFFKQDYNEYKERK